MAFSQHRDIVCCCCFQSVQQQHQNRLTFNRRVLCSFKSNLRARAQRRDRDIDLFPLPFARVKCSAAVAGEPFHHHHHHHQVMMMLSCTICCLCCCGRSLEHTEFSSHLATIFTANDAASEAAAASHQHRRVIRFCPLAQFGGTFRFTTGTSSSSTTFYYLFSIAISPAATTIYFSIKKTINPFFLNLDNAFFPKGRVNCLFYTFASWCFQHLHQKVLKCFFQQPDYLIELMKNNKHLF